MLKEGQEHREEQDTLKIVNIRLRSKQLALVCQVYPQVWVASSIMFFAMRL